MAQASVRRPADPRPARKTQVRRSRIHGRGVYALRDIAAGEVLLQYKGERITWEEAQRRHENQQGDPFHTFFFQTDAGDVIDGGVQGNSARWINHCCEPNCETQEDARGRVFIVAAMPIAAGQELCYDYALEIDARITAALKKDYACHCGTPSCRGTMLKTRRKPAAKAGEKSAEKSGGKGAGTAGKKAARGRA